MIVAKFGGTSISSSQNIKTICDIVKSGIKKKPVLVVSALSGITDFLISLSNSQDKTEIIKNIQKKHYSLINDFWGNDAEKKEILKFVDQKINEISEFVSNRKFNKQSLDKLVSFGEIMSSFIITAALNSKGIKSSRITATDLIVTNDSFGNAEFLLKPTRIKTMEVLLPLIKKGIVPVVTGFIGATNQGQITTLGRGGSDYSASIIGFCLKAREIQIWTDVDGVFTTDPRVVKNVKLLPKISFREASELAAFGAKVLHARTIKPAIKADIPVRVLNTFNIKNPGTLIAEKVDFSNPITAIAFKKNITLVNIYSTEMLHRIGFLAKIFKIFSKNNISIDLVSVSEVSISVTLDNNENLENAIKELSQFGTVSTTKNLGMISLVGEGIVTSSQIIHKIFDVLDIENILVKMISLGATDINVSLVVLNDQVDKAVRVLHNELLMKVGRKSK